MDNPKPIFTFKNIEIADVKIFGKKNDHLKLTFTNKKGYKISAIAFFKKPEDFSAKVATGEKIDLLANIEKSYFGGREELRLRIVDIYWFLNTLNNLTYGVRSNNIVLNVEKSTSK